MPRGALGGQLHLTRLLLLLWLLLVRLLLLWLLLWLLLLWLRLCLLHLLWLRLQLQQLRRRRQLLLWLRLSLLLWRCCVWSSRVADMGGRWVHALLL